MYCKWCEAGDTPTVLDIDGVLSSISGEPGCWAHAYEDNWWPCQRKAAELRALEVLAIEWVRAERMMVVAIQASGDGPILDGSAADLAAKRWDRIDDEFRAACQELAKPADDEVHEIKTAERDGPR